ncbi:tetratricopeptide repeat protein [Bradyrhizobium sp. UFLA05-153]
MIASAELDADRSLTTDGEIALINLESARRRSWSRFFADPQRVGVAETVVEQEQLTAQFVGDVCALDRLESLANTLAAHPSSARTALIQAQVSSMTHRFTDARRCLAQAEIGGAPTDDIRLLKLNVDQACGANLDSVLDQRREIARKSGRIEDLVTLAALLADLREFIDAHQIYTQALRELSDVSPLPPAGVCFQLGLLWGELVPEPDTARAAQWYKRAIDYFPSYTKARVHLAELYSRSGQLSEALALLIPALNTGDPEIRWRLSDVMARQGKFADAEAHMEAARCGFDSLLERHSLAFADHGAEFYAESGIDLRRALDLACLNVANRPTLRAFEQAHAIAVIAGDVSASTELLAEAARRLSASAAFRSSPMASLCSEVTA